MHLSQVYDNTFLINCTHPYNIFRSPKFLYAPFLFGLTAQRISTIYNSIQTKQFCFIMFLILRKQNHMVWGLCASFVASLVPHSYLCDSAYFPRGCTLSHSVVPTLCKSIDCTPPGFSVHGISQTKILQWVAISSSRGIFLTQELNMCLLNMCIQADILIGC